MQSDQQPDPRAGSDNTTSVPPQRSKGHKVLVRVATGVGLLLLLGGIFIWTSRWQDETSRTKTNTPLSDTTPLVDTSIVISGRQHIWEVAFLPSGEMLFTERGGTVSVVRDGREARQVVRITDVVAQGEGGLMGLAVDPSFAKNRFVYTCFNSTAPDIRIVRWRLADDLQSFQDRKDIVTGMPTNTTGSAGRHSGCRLAFGPDGFLWAGTGDAATGDTAIQPKSLGGKILRVDRDGNSATGNIGGEYDPRIYSYGHRNTQGIAFFPVSKNGAPGLSVEHGSTVDDEVNELKPGNFGWAPPATGYNETGVSMTDTSRFPDAIPAIWSSGDTTQAPAGATILTGTQWQGWEGAIVVAMLKTQHLKILRLDASNHATKEERILANEYGRLRAVVQGPDGSLYVGTSTGSNDKILKITPRQ